MSSPGEHCAETCRSRSHNTFGECIRAQNQKIAYCQSAAGRDYTEQKKWDKNITDFKDAYRQGIHPDTTKQRDVDRAVRISNETGSPYVGW